MKTTRRFLSAAISIALAFVFSACSSDSSGDGGGSSDSGLGSSSSDGGGGNPIANPDPPAGVIVSTNSTSSITVGWGAVSGATGYYIYRSASAAGVYEQVGTSTTTSYTDTGLSAGTAYHYRVAGYNSGGTGSQSIIVSADTQPDAPAGVEAAASSANSITVSWSSSKGATLYYIYRSTSVDGVYSQVGSSVATSYANTGLAAATTYYYKVAAFNGGGSGPQSEAVSAATLSFVPAGVAAAVTSANKITVSWSEVTGALVYRIYRSESSDGDYAQVGTSIITSYIDNGLTMGTTYYYKVAAFNGTSEGPMSEAVFETPRTTPSEPQNIIAISGNGQAMLSWTAPSSDGGSAITGYQVSSDNGSTWVSASNSTSHTFASLSNGTSYAFKVRAVNVAGSGTEASASATPRNYGSVSDGAGKTYKTIEIGAQTWMAENLNYDVSGSVCYDNNPANCAIYGRLYDWATALTVCPDGWHLPTDAEWTVLTNYIDGLSTAGTKLKATYGWNQNGNGTDNYGFAALPGGYGYSGNFSSAGNGGSWWSASEDDVGGAYSRYMSYGYENVSAYNSDKTGLFSVRCVKD